MSSHDPMLGDIEVTDRVETVQNLGSAPSFFSCWDMHAYYGESYIVQGVNFDIREGEVIALLGRNGAGKTSTLRSTQADHLALVSWLISRNCEYKALSDIQGRLYQDLLGE